jgi:hypothetical protein
VSLGSRSSAETCFGARYAIAISPLSGLSSQSNLARSEAYFTFFFDAPAIVITSSRSASIDASTNFSPNLRPNRHWRGPVSAAGAHQDRPRGQPRSLPLLQRVRAACRVSRREASTHPPSRQRRRRWPRLNRAEHLRAIPPTDPDYHTHSARRVDAESVNRKLSGTLYWAAHTVLATSHRMPTSSASGWA